MNNVSAAVNNNALSGVGAHVVLIRIFLHIFISISFETYYFSRFFTEQYQKIAIKIDEPTKSIGNELPCLFAQITFISHIIYVFCSVYNIFNFIDNVGY